MCTEMLPVRQACRPAMCYLYRALSQAAASVQAQINYEQWCFKASYSKSNKLQSEFKTFQPFSTYMDPVHLEF